MRTIAQEYALECHRSLPRARQASMGRSMAALGPVALCSCCVEPEREDRDRGPGDSDGEPASSGPQAPRGRAAHSPSTVESGPAVEAAVAADGAVRAGTSLASIMRSLQVPPHDAVFLLLFSSATAASAFAAGRAHPTDGDRLARQDRVAGHFQPVLFDRGEMRRASSHGSHGSSPLSLTALALAATALLLCLCHGVRCTKPCGVGS
jgi:hypothetical protein